MSDSTPNGNGEKNLPAPPPEAATIRAAPMPIMILGVVACCGVLAVLAYLALRPTAVSCSAQNFVVLFFALGCAAATASLGGYAAFRGNVPNVGVVSFGGVAAVLLVVLLVVPRVMGHCEDRLVWGTITGLQRGIGSSIDDSVTPPQGSSMETFQDARPANDGVYVFKWAISFGQDPSRELRFRLVHRYPVQAVAAGSFQFVNSSDAVQPPPAQGAPAMVVRMFTLPNDPAPVDLEYRPAENAQAGGVGTLHRLNVKGQPAVELQLADSSAGEAKRTAALFGSGVVYAARLESGLPAFQMKRRGVLPDAPCSSQASAQEGQQFMDRLGNTDLATQKDARDRLINKGAACLDFITAALKTATTTSPYSDRWTLVANLTAATDAIAATGVPIPGRTWGLIGEWQYKLSQFDKAAEYFGRIRDASTFAENPTLLFDDAYSKMRLGRLEEAEARYDQYAKQAPQEAQSSAAFHANRGNLYLQLGQKVEKSDANRAASYYARSQTELALAVQMITRANANSPVAHGLRLTLGEARQKSTALKKSSR